MFRGKKSDNLYNVFYTLSREVFTYRINDLTFIILMSEL